MSRRGIHARLTGNARVAGLQKDLELTDSQFQICLMVFFMYVRRIYLHSPSS